jgi:predicted protein tyrosine phosphatase
VPEALWSAEACCRFGAGKQLAAGVGEGWLFLPCSIGDNQAFIFLNTGVAEVIHLAPASLAKVVLTYKSPRENGLPTHEESEPIRVIEDRGEAFLKNGNDWYVGMQMKKRILFLCSQNKLRSPTAEAIFVGHPGIEVDSAGLNNDAEVPLSEEQVRWADLIVVMEKVHRARLNRKFKSVLAGKRIAVLNIPDEYDYMDPALIELLRARCSAYLP